ncbi:MAG: hypothetical protein K2G87_01645, partial [Oscillospiraceae bacterium]|nr:hypothetical protein [Oscillospiraceae bacterium]
MKRIKETVIEVLVIAAVIAVMLILYSLPNVLEDTTLYIFGNFIAEGIFHGSLFLLLLLPCLFLHIKFFKEYYIVKKIIYPLLLCVAAVISVYDIADTVNDFSAKEEINLTDGSKIVLYEEKSSSGTTIDVYKVKGIIAKNIGYCWESIYCSDYCLKENKWDYTYNEADKKLTLILKYDEPRGS